MIRGCQLVNSSVYATAYSAPTWLSSSRRPRATDGSVDTGFSSINPLILGNSKQRRTKSNWLAGRVARITVSAMANAVSSSGTHLIFLSVKASSCRA